MIAPLGRLTERGLEKFSAFLDILKGNPASPPPSRILDEETMVVPVLKDGRPIMVDSKVKFANRLQAAEYLDAVLQGLEKECDIDADIGLWSWLALLFFDQVCPPKSDNNMRKVGERSRYILAPSDYTRYYRHLLAGPFRIYRAYKSNPSIALACLCQPLDKPGDIVEQLTSRPDWLATSSIMEVATRLYVDHEKGCLKRGAQGKKNGSIRRFCNLLAQLEICWDLPSMTADELMEKLPPEFAAFR